MALSSAACRPLFRKIDGLSIPVPDLDAALAFYSQDLGHEIIWRSTKAAGLRLPDSTAELVLHSDDRKIVRRHVMSKKSLYERLGGYDALTAVANDLLPRLQGDPQLGRFWKNRSDDGIAREKQLLIDYLCASTGGPMYYTGRDMKTSHKGMQITESDWTAFLGHASATLDAFRVPSAEREEVVGFVLSLKSDIVDA